MNEDTKALVAASLTQAAAAAGAIDTGGNNKGKARDAFVLYQRFLKALEKDDPATLD